MTQEASHNSAFVTYEQLRIPVGERAVYEGE
jgi:hypothetical protein